MTIIKTHRLALKHLSHGDMARLVELIGVAEVALNLSGVPHPYTLSDAEDWLARVRESPFNLSIFLDDELIGGVGLSDCANGTYELGYWIGVDYWGRGFAAEAAAGLLNFVALQIRPLVVVANVYKENVVSAKVLRKLGFIPTGMGEVFSLSRQAQVATFTYSYTA
jgi:RimJ/RimL family protein N-acetyltransferase